MRLLDWLLIAAHNLASTIDGATDDRHLTTDPACARHVPPRSGSRLDRSSRGMSCTPCMVARAFATTQPSAEAQSLRERIKIAIQTAQDSGGALLYVIPPGVAGMYADSVMRVLTGQPYPEPHGSEEVDRG